MIVNGEINFTAGGTDEHRFCLRGVGNIRIRVFVGKENVQISLFKDICKYLRISVKKNCRYL